MANHLKGAIVSAAATEPTTAHRNEIYLVGEDRQVRRVAGHPPDGTKIGKGARVVAGAVGSEARGLANHGETRGQ